MIGRHSYSALSGWSRTALVAALALMLSACANPLKPAPETGLAGGLQPTYSRVSPDDHLAGVPDELLFPKELPEMSVSQKEQLGDLMLRRGNLPGAFVQYEKCLAEAPGNPRLRYKKGLALLAGERFDEASRELESLVREQPDFSRAHEALGRAHFGRQAYTPAETHLREALRLDPDLWTAANLLGNILDYRRQYPQAVEAYRQALRVKPENGRLHNNLGVSLMLDHRYPEAAAALRQALRLGPTDPRLFNNLGMALAGAGDYTGALEAFRRGGTEANAYNNLGCVYLNQKKYAEAAACFEKAIAASPTFYVKASENLRQAKSNLARQ